MSGIELASGTIIAHAQTTATFDDTLSSYFYPISANTFACGFRSRNDYLFIGKTLRPVVVWDDHTNPGVDEGRFIVE